MVCMVRRWWALPAWLFAACTSSHPGGSSVDAPDASPEPDPRSSSDAGPDGIGLTDHRDAGGLPDAAIGMPPDDGTVITNPRPPRPSLALVEVQNHGLPGCYRC